MKVLDVYAGEFGEELRFELVDAEGSPLETTGASAGVWDASQEV